MLTVGLTFFKPSFSFFQIQRWLYLEIYLLIGFLPWSHPKWGHQRAAWSHTHSWDLQKKSCCGNLKRWPGLSILGGWIFEANLGFLGGIWRLIEGFHMGFWSGSKFFIWILKVDPSPITPQKLVCRPASDHVGSLLSFAFGFLCPMSNQLVGPT